MTTERQLSFSYDGLPKRDATALEKHAARIVATQDRVRRTTAEGTLAIGKELAAAQERLANHGNGTFGKWVKERCGISTKTAYKAIAAHATFKDREHCTQSFDASALYLLSSDSTPEEATAKALELAEQGEQITHKRAKEIVAELLPPEPEDSVEEWDEEEADIGDWSLSDYLLDIRTAVKRWERVCPETERTSLAEVLRDIAAQIEASK